MPGQLVFISILTQFTNILKYFYGIFKAECNKKIYKMIETQKYMYGCSMSHPLKVFRCEFLNNYWSNFSQFSHTYFLLILTPYWQQIIKKLHFLQVNQGLSYLYFHTIVSTAAIVFILWRHRYWVFPYKLLLGNYLLAWGSGFNFLLLKAQAWQILTVLSE